jgi:hypothetical protein
MRCLKRLAQILNRKVATEYTHWMEMDDTLATLILTMSVAVDGYYGRSKAMKQKASEMLRKAMCGDDKGHYRDRPPNLPYFRVACVEFTAALSAVEALEAERDGLLALLKQTATAFQENNRSLTANQANAWQAIEQALRGEQKGVG